MFHDIEKYRFLFSIIFYLSQVSSTFRNNKKMASKSRVEEVNKYWFYFRPVRILIMHLVRLFFVQIIAYDYAKYNVLNEFI